MVKAFLLSLKLKRDTRNVEALKVDVEDNTSVDSDINIGKDEDTCLVSGNTVAASVQNAGQ